MGESESGQLCWSIATDHDELHALLLDSDAEQARRYALPAPRRNPATTQRRVRAGEVWVIRLGGQAVGSFTLSADPPFDVVSGVFPQAKTPMYLSRLCVSSHQLSHGSLVGLRCLRQAIAVATQAGADALRSQANPDFVDVLEMLRLHGFAPRGMVTDAGPLRVVNLQKDLAPGTAGRAR